MIFWISHHSELLLSKFEQWLVLIVVNNPHPTRWAHFYNRVYILEYFNKMKDKEAEPCLLSRNNSKNLSENETCYKQVIDRSLQIWFSDFFMT